MSNTIQEIKQFILKPIKGSLLEQTIFDGYLSFVYPEYVSHTANESILKIKKYYGSIPNNNGYNNIGICNLQNLLYQYAGGLPKLYSFVITAPHTHWDNDLPVMYHFDAEKNRYLIGPQKINKDIMYTPVSFVFSNIGLLPYEWADESINIEETEFNLSINTLNKINNGTLFLSPFFGVSLNFRFKNSMYEFPKISVEHPLPTINGNELAEILLLDDYGNKYGDEQVEQVAWTPIPKDMLQLTDEEEEIYTAILNNINELSDVEKINVINKILN